MRVLLYAILFVLLAALWAYFLGTPALASLTGLAPRTISLLSGSAVMISALVAMLLGRRAAHRGPRGAADIDSRR